MQPGQTQTPQPNLQPQPQVEPTQWQFVDEQQAPQVEDASSPDAHVAWSASEFIAYQKSAGWYIGMFTVVIAIAAIILLLTGIVTGKLASST